MDMNTHTGNAPFAERRISVVSHIEDEHEFCSECGMCIDCDDCAIWGCGKSDDGD